MTQLVVSVDHQCAENIGPIAWNADVKECHAAEGGAGRRQRLRTNDRCDDVENFASARDPPRISDHSQLLESLLVPHRGEAEHLTARRSGDPVARDVESRSFANPRAERGRGHYRSELPVFCDTIP